jgi:asparagine synthase (glutamine-hydrolysing)
MPRNLSQRIKVGFWSTTFQRMEARPEIFDSPQLGALFGMTGAQLRTLAEAGSHDFRLRLLHCDIWMRVMVEGEAPEISVMRLRDNVRIREQTETSRYAHSSLQRRAAGATF